MAFSRTSRPGTYTKANETEGRGKEKRQGKGGGKGGAHNDRHRTREAEAVGKERGKRKVSRWAPAAYRRRGTRGLDSVASDARLLLRRTAIVRLLPSSGPRPSCPNGLQQRANGAARARLIRSAHACATSTPRRHARRLRTVGNTTRCALPPPHPQTPRSAFPPHEASSGSERTPQIARLRHHPQHTNIVLNAPRAFSDVTHVSACTRSVFLAAPSLESPPPTEATERAPTTRHRPRHRRSPSGQHRSLRCDTKPPHVQTQPERAPSEQSPHAPAAAASSSSSTVARPSRRRDATLPASSTRRSHLAKSSPSPLRNADRCGHDRRARYLHGTPAPAHDRVKHRPPPQMRQ
ncbi:hypothetical protein C8R45DRAFT_945890 [Mycena sanguinolenta]|nr:hypothetical protein C8R45DRAFT_945890 [Mycena sanguinolenta]